MEGKMNSTIFFLFTFSLLTLTSSQSPGPRYSHCLATYQNTLYLFGGISTTTKDFFFSADLPFNNTNSILWRKETTINAENVNDTACVVEPTLGLLLIIGGGSSAHSTTTGNPGLQVYDFKRSTWNDPKYLQNIPYEFSYYLYRPRAALIAPKTVFVWAGTFNLDSFPSTGIYQIDLSKIPWNWTLIFHDSIPMKPTNGAGLAISDGNAFIFGGMEYVDETNWPPTNYAYNYSSKVGLLSTAPYQFPFNISDGAVGILNSTLTVLVMNDGSQMANQSLIMVQVDLKTRKIGIPVLSNQPYMRDRAATVQFPGSDTILIYGGGIPGGPNPRPLDSMLAYNMTTSTWTNQVNIVNWYNLDSSVNSSGNGVSPANGTSPRISETLIGVVSSSVAIVCAVGIVIVGVWQIKRLKKQHAIQLETTIASLSLQDSSLASSLSSTNTEVRKQPKNSREKNGHVDRVDNEVVDFV